MSAKNKSMEIKHAKAKKYALADMKENENIRSCTSYIFNKPQSVIFNMKYKPYTICNKKK